MEVQSLAHLVELGPGVRTSVELTRINEMRDILPRVSGVYFLWDGRTPVYIGCSVDVGARVWTHIREQRDAINGRWLGKKWDFANWLECPPEEREFIEAKYIYTYLPKYNGTLSLSALRKQAGCLRYEKVA